MGCCDVKDACCHHAWACKCDLVVVSIVVEYCAEQISALHGHLAELASHILGCEFLHCACLRNGWPWGYLDSVDLVANTLRVPQMHG